jgi:type IV pilus assembly protein PilB
MAVSPSQVHVAPASSSERPLLGTFLVRKGQLTVDDLQAALAEQERSGRPIGQVLLGRGLITTHALAEALAEQHGLDYIDLGSTQVDPAAALRLPESVARRYHALPVKFIGDTVVVAVADPTNLLAHDDLRFAIGTDVQIAVADSVQLEAAINDTHRTPLEAVESFSSTAEPQGATVREIRTGPGEASPAISLVNDVISRAIALRSSDIHFEPQAEQLAVRVRVDGVTRELTSVPSSLHPAVIARLKVMGGLDIAQRRAPQDGRVAIHLGDQPMDLRIAVLPTVYGEQVVLRILHRTFGGPLDMSQLGMAPQTEATIRQALARPYGAIIACGPTGSGKTTTLYASLDILNDPGSVLVTIEDPVEYQMQGVSQIEIDPLAGLTFARGLRTILRSDPDVILVGEIRDEETARIAMQAATTGHLVLTTLHAHSASSSIVRLKDMGVDSGLLAASVNCVVAQRLARRLCLKCREPYSPGDDERSRFGLESNTGELQLYRPRGCADCMQTGFQGRVALYEAMPVEGKIRRLIDGSTEEIFAAAIEQGMTTLRDSGVSLCLAGVTSLDEVHRVTGDRIA